MMQIWQQIRLGKHVGFEEGESGAVRSSCSPASPSGVFHYGEDRELDGVVVVVYGRSGRASGTFRTVGSASLSASASAHGRCGADEGGVDDVNESRERQRVDRARADNGSVAAYCGSA